MSEKNAKAIEKNAYVKQKLDRKCRKKKQLVTGSVLKVSRNKAKGTGQTVGFFFYWCY